MLWEAWLLAKGLGVRPSELYGIHDEVSAYCFDRAVYTFGSQCEADIEKARAKAKNDKAAQAAAQRALDKWLGIQHFKDPAAR
jgi:hypothetical protein